MKKTVTYVPKREPLFRIPMRSKLGARILISFTGLILSAMIVVVVVAQAMGENRRRELDLIGIGEEVVAGLRTASPVIADGPLAMLMVSEGRRLGCEVKPGNISDYLSAVRKIESEGNPRAVSSAGARDLYQFKPESRSITARYGMRYAARNWGHIPVWLQELAENTDPEVEILEDRWQFLTTMHAIMRDGSDLYLKGSLCGGDMEDAIALYERFHHTNPDSRTSVRARRVFEKIWRKPE